MLTCLFWNYNSSCKTPDKESIPANLALYHHADILILNETTTDPQRVLDSLGSKGVPYFIPSDIRERVQPEVKKGGLTPIRFQVYTRLKEDQFRLFREGGRSSIWKLKREGELEVLLTLMHFYSKRSYPGRDPFEGQHKASAGEYLTIHQAEDDARHTRTVVIGDFNMNPFEKGMIDPDGFGAMMSRELAELHSSPTMSKPGTRRFYNPVWSHMGRALPAPPGTFYWDEIGDPLNIYWHCYDQLLIRPELLKGFRDEYFKILTLMPADGGWVVELIRSKRKHWETRFSDHLPLLFKLELPKEQGHG